MNTSRPSPPDASPLRQRHRLVWPDRAGWVALRATFRDESPDSVGRDCLAHWEAIDAPLVVTRRREGLEPGLLDVGLPAPARWQRRRLALRLPIDAVARSGEFPRAAAIDGLLPAEVRHAWQRLTSTLDALGAEVRVHGSHGWQALTGETCLHPDSDLDLLLRAADADTADAIADALARAAFEAPRLDGELLFGDGGGVAWREWRRYRAGQADRVLVKRIDGVALEAPPVASLSKAMPC